MKHTTNTQGSSVKPVHIACAVCLKEIPLSEAIVSEARDYVAHFCSPDCYQTWHQQTGVIPPEKTA